MSRFLNEPSIRILLPERLESLGLEGPWFEVSEDFTYDSDKLGLITVKAGFLTDFASIPGWAQVWLKSDDPRISPISIVHDWGYTQKLFTREQYDQMLFEGMTALGARWSMAKTVYLAVRLGGGSHWKS